MYAILISGFLRVKPTGSKEEQGLLRVEPTGSKEGKDQRVEPTGSLDTKSVKINYLDAFYSIM